MRVDFEVVGRFAHELRLLDDQEQQFKCFQHHVLNLGFDGATYTFMPGMIGKKQAAIAPMFVHTDEYPLPFLEHYQDKGFVKHDFTVDKASKGWTDAMVWHDYLKSGLLTAQQANVLTVARDAYGIRQGVTIPTLGGPKGVAGVSLISTENDRIFEMLRSECLGTMVELAQLFHNYILNAPQSSKRLFSPFSNLNEKQRGLLCHLARGKPLKQIEDSIPVGSERVAYNMLDEIRRKLGGINKDRLMYLVGMYDLLDEGGE